MANRNLFLLPDGTRNEKRVRDNNFPWTALSKAGRWNGVTLCETPTCETKADHNTGNSMPFSLR